MKTFLKWVLITLSVSIVVGLITLFSSLDFVENYEVAFLFNTQSGEISPIMAVDGKPKVGWVMTYPIVRKVYTVDTRPVQICISANSRVLNCKLISFNPKGYKQFFDWHGIRDYSLSRSTGGGVSGSMNQFEDILMSYAFDPSNSEYEFLSILKDNNNVTKSIQTPKDSIK